MPLTSAFLRDHRPGGQPTARSERVLAVGRAFLTITGLIAIYLDPTEPSRLAAVTYTVLSSYAVYSLGVLAYVHAATRLTRRHGLTLHALDVLWTSGLTFVSEGPLSPFFLFFLFVVLAAAYRWGFRETLATAAITAAVFLVETAIASVGPFNRRWFTSIDVELNRTILRVTYLLLTGFLLGYLAEQDKQARAEIAAIVDIMRLPRVDLGLGGSLAAVAHELLDAFRARAAAIVLVDRETSRTRLWTFDSAAAAADVVRDNGREIGAAGRGAWLFPDAGRAWHARLDGRAGWTVRGIDAGTRPQKRLPVDLPREITGVGAVRTVSAVNMGMPGEWDARLYLFDAAEGYGVERWLDFLSALAGHVAPALSNVFLLGRLRAQAGEAERARVARELHDGAIQALFGIEMKIEALRRRSDLSPTALAAELAEVQHMVRQEVLELRDLMQALRPIELDNTHQLSDVLAGMVVRFRRDTGLAARFVTAGSTPVLSPPTALELVRIVQEALINVRKHGRARNVLVQVTGTDHGCSLVVEDDGCGLEFEGRFTADELERRRVGPVIIQERARIAGARLAIDSTPGEGTRIELTFPEVAHG